MKNYAQIIIIFIAYYTFGYNIDVYEPDDQTIIVQPNETYHFNITYFNNNTGSLFEINKTDISIQTCVDIKFCSQCDSFKLCSLDDNGDDLNCIKSSYTGTIYEPNESLIVSNHKFISFNCSKNQCSFIMDLFENDTCEYNPLAPVIENRAVEYTRIGKNIKIRFKESSCMSEECLIYYNIYGYKSLERDIYEEEWCSVFSPLLLNATYKEEYNISVHELEFVVIDVVAMNMVTNKKSNYQRVFIERSLSNVGLIITANIFSPIIFIIPSIVIYTGYYHLFRPKKHDYSYFDYGKSEDKTINENIKQGKQSIYNINYILERTTIYKDEVENISKTFKRAILHSFVFIILQIICQLTLIILSIIHYRFLSLHLIISILSLPILILGGLSLIKYNHYYTIGYILMIIWIISLQLTIMQLFINFSDNFINQTDENFSEWPIIIIQFIVTISSTLALLSLIPQSYIFIKKSGSLLSNNIADISSNYFNNHRNKPLALMEKMILLNVFIYIMLTVIWNGLSFYYLTYSIPGKILSIRPLISSHLHISFALLTIFIVIHILYQYERRISFINSIVLLISLPFSLIQLISDIITKWHLIIDIIHPSKSMTIIIYILRSLSIISLLSLSILLISIHRSIEKKMKENNNKTNGAYEEEDIDGNNSIIIKDDDINESYDQLLFNPTNVYQYFNPKLVKRKIGIIKTIILFILIIEFIGTFITVIFDITGKYSFPSVNLMLYILFLASPSTMIGLFSYAPHFLIYSLFINIAPFSLWIIFLKNENAWLIMPIIIIIKCLLMIFVTIKDIFEKEDKINHIKSLIIEDEETNRDVEMENFNKGEKESKETDSEDEITEITISSSSK